MKNILSTRNLNASEVWFLLFLLFLVLLCDLSEDKSTKLCICDFGESIDEVVGLDKFDTLCGDNDILIGHIEFGDLFKGLTLITINTI